MLFCTFITLVRKACHNFFQLLMKALLFLVCAENMPFQRYFFNIYTNNSQAGRWVFNAYYLLTKCTFNTFDRLKMKRYLLNTFVAWV